MRICLIPLKTEVRKPLVNIEHLKDRLDKAMCHRPDLVCFPECTITGYLCSKDDFTEFAEPIPGPTTSIIGRLAKEKKTYICFGLLESAAEGTYNTAVLFDGSGNIVLKHRKISEKPPFVSGNILTFADTALGRLGILICGDLFDKKCMGHLDTSLDFILTPMSRGFGNLSPDEDRWIKEERQAYLEEVKTSGKTTFLVNALETCKEGPAFGGAMVINSQGCLLAESRHGTDTELVWDLNSKIQL
ncbi:MAG: carbon-nitrogen hydrolase family protein [Candidatus Edwardsbacteria bacterium]|nr:carbon-nitrogen hydrolase family protein [Candidatus Edwardsbacteria bacterium]